jgi:hypothetical protein
LFVDLLWLETTMKTPQAALCVLLVSLLAASCSQEHRLGTIVSAPATSGQTYAAGATLAREQSEVQQRREAFARHQRCVDTRLLTIRFVEKGGEESFWKKIPKLGDHFSQGIYEALRVTLYGFPFLILLFFTVLLWAWRRLVGRRTSGR